MRRFYSPPENFDKRSITLDAGETAHLRDVLRLRQGEAVNVFDGTGREFECEIEAIESKSTRLRLVREVSPASPESSLDLTLAATILKGEKFDLVVQKAVELGVAALIPLHTGRSDVKLRKTENKLQRWRKIALESTKQCGRARLMRIEEPVDLTAFLNINSKRRMSESLLMFSERDGTDFSGIKPTKKMTALIGPTGGWDDSELETAQKSGFQIITLGGRILRAETAAIAIASILQHRFGDLN